MQMTLMQIGRRILPHRKRLVINSAAAAIDEELLSKLCLLKRLNDAIHPSEAILYMVTWLFFLFLVFFGLEQSFV